MLGLRFDSICVYQHPEVSAHAMFVRECQNDSETIVLDMSASFAQLFRVKCESNRTGGFSGFSDKASLTLGQCIARDGVQQIWDFVLVLADRKGTRLTTRVLLCHPDWDEPFEIASIESNGENLKVGLVQGTRPP